MSASAKPPVVGIIMGSQSDWPTMRHASETLTALGVPHERRIVSAHRSIWTPKWSSWPPYCRVSAPKWSAWPPKIRVPDE